MSRAWMPWYIGDYLSDTGHLSCEQHGAYMLLLAHCWQNGALPADPSERAAICKLSSARWNKIKAPIERFFDGDGKNRRLTKELERSEAVRIRRKISGAKGGTKSAIARSVAKQTISNMAASRKQMLEQTSEQKTTNRVDNHNHIETLLQEETLVEPIEGPDEEQIQAGSLATALPAGALASQPEAECQGEPERRPKPHETSRAELEAMFTRRSAVAERRQGAK